MEVVESAELICSLDNAPDKGPCGVDISGDVNGNEVGMVWIKKIQ